MLSHYLLTLYRSLTRQWLYAALNVLGLAVGIAVFLVLMLDVRFETSFDDWIPDAANIYRITSIYAFPGRPTAWRAPRGRSRWVSAPTIRVPDSSRDCWIPREWSPTARSSVRSTWTM